jgi:hypothetical protein
MRVRKPRQPAVRHDKLKGTVGGAEEAPGHGNALLLIAVQEVGLRAAFDHQGKLPGQIVGVLQARIHPLRTHWAVDVRRITEQEAAPIPKPLSGPVVDTVR